MIITPIADVLKMEDGDIVKAVQGVIQAVYETKSGDGAHGHYTIQSIKLRQNGADIKVKFFTFGQEIPKSYKGQSIVLEARKSDRGYTGIKVKVDRYKSKKDGRDVVETYLHVTSSATLTIAGSDAESPRDDNEPPPTQTRSASPQSQQTQAPRQDNRTQEGQIAKIKKTLARSANLYVMCLDSADYVNECYAAKHGGESMDVELYSACVAQIFAEAKSSGLVVETPIFEMRKSAAGSSETNNSNPDDDGYDPDPESDREQ